jgi:hypothetical protein
MKKAFFKLALACSLLTLPALLPAPAKADHCEWISDFRQRAQCECDESCGICGGYLIGGFDCQCWEC